MAVRRQDPSTLAAAQMMQPGVPSGPIVRSAPSAPVNTAVAPQVGQPVQNAGAPVASASPATSGGYNVYAQGEQGQQSADQQSYMEMVQNYMRQIQSLGFQVNMPTGYGDAYNNAGAGVQGGLGSTDSGITNNWYQQAATDFVGDKKNALKGGGLTAQNGSSILAPAMGGLDPQAAVRGRKNWRSNQAAAAQRAAEAHAIFANMQNQMSGDASKNAASEAAQVRGDMSKYIQGQFQDPSHQEYYKTIYDTNMNRGLDQVNNAYRNTLTHSVEDAAQRGLVGGTVDAQARANIGAARDSGAAQVGQAATQARQQAQSQDQNTMAQLQGMVNSGDPTQMAQAQLQMQQLSTQNQGLQQQGQNDQANFNLQQWMTQLNSQGLGGFAGAANSGMQQKYGQQAVDQAWTGSGGSGG